MPLQQQNQIISMMPQYNLGLQFEGFTRPTANYYRLPNNWFDIWQQVRDTLIEDNRSVRIIAPLKITEYLIKWTWGWSNFDQPLRISRSELRTGRLDRHGNPIDSGTGLGSEASISRGIEISTQLGLLEQIIVTDDLARQERYLLPRLQPPVDELFPNDDAHSFTGFSSPKQNFFIVPKSWGDTAAEIKSEVLILSIEYFFRHTWGWQMRDDEIRWLDVDDVVTGRRYRSVEREGERYDGGTGYSARQVRAALADGVQRGLLVWRNGADSQREYALRLAWMSEVRYDGYYETTNNAETESAAKPVGPTAKSVGPAAKLVGPTAKLVDPAAKLVDRTCKDTDSKTLTPTTPDNTITAKHRAAPSAAADFSQTDHIIYFRPELATGELDTAQPLAITEAAKTALTNTGAFYWSAADLQSPRNLDAGEQFTPDEIDTQTTLDAAIFDNAHAVITDGEQFQRRQLLELAQQNTAVIHDVWQLLDLPRPPNLELALAKRRQRLDQLREQHNHWGHPELTTALEKIDIAPTEAQQLINRHGPGLVGGWLRTVRQRGDRLTNPAGLLIAKLRAGETPPGGAMIVANITPTPPNPLAHINHLLTQLITALREAANPQFTSLAATLAMLQEML